MKFPLVGNERVAAAVSSFADSGRIPHAILIEGEPGLGRHTLAKYIAALAVCGSQNPPCGECRSCHLADIGTHPDISVTAPEEKKKNIAVAQIRALRLEAYVKPHMAAHRVFIVDRADTMNDQSQNALLKVLEEPPGEVIFILIAESKASFLETVLSRCVLLGLSTPEYGEGLKYLVEKGFDGQMAASALKTAGNNIGKAMDTLTGRREDKYAAAAESFLSGLFGGSEFELLKITAEFEKDRIGAEAFLKQLKLTAVRLMRDNVNNSVYTAAMFRIYSEFEKLEGALKTNINLPLMFCTLVCRAREAINF